MRRLESRISKLEQVTPGEGNAIPGIVRVVIDPDTPDVPMRFAEGEGLRFTAGDGETEDQFRERVESSMPKDGVRPWRLVLYPYRPEGWDVDQPNRDSKARQIGAEGKSI